MGAIKNHNWVIWCPPGNSGLPQETVALSGSREGQESLREQIVIHDQHSSLEVILPQASCWEGRKWLLDSTGNVWINSFDRFFFAIRAPAQDWSGYFPQWAATPLSAPRKNLNREHSFPGWVTPHWLQILSFPWFLHFALCVWKFVHMCELCPLFVFVQPCHLSFGCVCLSS